MNLQSLKALCTLNSMEKPNINPRQKPPKPVGDEEIPEQEDPSKDDIGDPMPGKKIEDPRRDDDKKIKLPPDPDQNPEKPNTD